MKLYEINEALVKALEQAEIYASENDGVLPEDLDMKIDALEMVREDKIGNVARYVKNSLAEADAIKREADVLAKRAKTVQNRALWAKQYLSNNIPKGEKYSDTVVAVSWRKSEAVSIYDESVIPDEFVKIERKPVKTEIKKAIKSGQEVGGCEIVENMNLQIK